MKTHTLFIQSVVFLLHLVLVSAQGSLTLYEIAYTNLYTASTGTPAVATPIGTAEGGAATTYKAGLEDYLVTISDDIVRVMTTFTVDVTIVASAAGWRMTEVVPSGASDPNPNVEAEMECFQPDDTGSGTCLRRIISQGGTATQTMEIPRTGTMTPTVLAIAGTGNGAHRQTSSWLMFGMVAGGIALAVLL